MFALFAVRSTPVAIGHCTTRIKPDGRANALHFAHIVRCRLILSRGWPYDSLRSRPQYPHGGENMATGPRSIAHHFATLTDPRRKHLQRHRFLDIVVIALCGVLCGCNTWPEIETFGQRRRLWLQRFLPLPGGIPSHDTFERVFERLDPDALQRCLLNWLRALTEGLALRHIAIDGKTLRGSG